MISIVYNKSYKEPPFDKKEALRYAGVRGDDAACERMIDECFAELSPSLVYRACYVELSLDEPLAKRMLGSSESLRATLGGSRSMIIFAATVGIAPDKLIRRYSLFSPAKALTVQAVGSERIEALCDGLCLELSAEYASRGLSLTRRFSPGYGDLPLEWQRDIFALLSPEKNIGLTLGESLLMTPAKSVSAIIGVLPRSADTEE